MRDNPYKDLPPLERRPNGSLYRMTPAQRKQAASLIRLEDVYKRQWLRDVVGIEVASDVELPKTLILIVLRVAAAVK